MIDEISTTLLISLGVLLVVGVGIAGFLRRSIPIQKIARTVDTTLERFVDGAVYNSTLQFRINIIRQIDENVYSNLIRRYMNRINESVDSMESLEKLSQQQYKFFISNLPDQFYSQKVLESYRFLNRQGDFDRLELELSEPRAQLRSFCLQLHDFNEEKIRILVNIVRKTTNEDRQLIEQVSELRARILKLENELKNPGAVPGSDISDEVSSNNIVTRDRESGAAAQTPDGQIRTKE
jgi:hypothetical protein